MVGVRELFNAIMYTSVCSIVSGLVCAVCVRFIVHNSSRRILYDGSSRMIRVSWVCHTVSVES